jgi:hypothetical protein
VLTGAATDVSPEADECTLHSIYEWYFPFKLLHALLSAFMRATRSTNLIAFI